ncbi:discoidin domain-containing protein [Raineyella fluvialis]
MWPGGTLPGLPSAPTRGGMWPSPRRVRTDVPPALDRLCQQVIGGVSPMMENVAGKPGIATAAGVVAALSNVLGVTDASYRLEQRVRSSQGTLSLDATREQPAVPAHPPAPTTAAVPPEPSHRPLKVVPRQTPRRGWVVALLVVVALAIVVGLIGVALRSGGSGQPRTGASSASTSPTPSRSTDAGPWQITGVSTFDPAADGGNNEENDRSAQYAADGDPNTQWQTMSYVGDARFGKLKPGVGLVLDLGRPRDVRTAKVQLAGNGTNLEMRVPKNAAVTSAPMDTEKSWRAVASASGASGTVDLTTSSPVTTRYVMIYLTSLPTDGGGQFRGGSTRCR